MWAICSFTSRNDDHFPDEMFAMSRIDVLIFMIIYNYLFINIPNVIFISRVRKLTISVMLSNIW